MQQKHMYFVILYVPKYISGIRRSHSSDGKGGLLAPEDFHSQEFKKALRNNGEEYG